jgi:hypothetical protein
MKTKAIVIQEQLHSQSIIGVAWSPHDPNLIATASGDSTSCLYDISKKKVQTIIKVKGKLKRIRWSQKSAVIAIGCDDGSLYVRREGGAYRIMEGSRSPLFDVAYNPFNDQIVASTDDSGQILVFNLETGSVNVWPGHNGPGRAVVWCPVLEYMLFSGGYDGRVNVWDVRTKTRLVSIEAHSSHIYSLAIHPNHPMLLATVSRDETVRLWSIDRYLPRLKIEAVLSGNRFAIEKFCPFEGASSLTKLVHRLLRDGVRCSFGDGDQCHVNDVVKVAQKRVAQITASVPRDSDTLSRAPTARRNLVDAADLSLKSGDVKRYCELLFIAGEHDRALSAAPAVSFNFWQGLMTMRSDMLKGSEMSAQFALIAGRPELAVERLAALREFDAAALVVAALRETEFVPRTKSRRIETPKTARPFCQRDFDDPADLSAYRVASIQAKKHIEQGRPLRAAAALLAVGDVASAACALLHCGELCWAKVVSVCAQFACPIDRAFADFCIYHGCTDIIGKVPEVGLIAGLEFPDIDARDEFYRNHGLGGVQGYVHDSVHTKGVKRVKNCILAGKLADAQSAAVGIARAMLQRESWDFEELSEVVAMLRNVKTPVNEFVAICHLCGVYRAMWRGYHQIVRQLLQSLRDCEVEWLGSQIEMLEIAVALTLAKSNPVVARVYVGSLEHRLCEAFDGIADIADAVDGGALVKGMGSGVIPIDMESTYRMSICSGERIYGNVFMLEDEVTAISTDEALMWFEVTPYSPLKTHHKLCPY